MRREAGRLLRKTPAVFAGTLTGHCGWHPDKIDRAKRVTNPPAARRARTCAILAAIATWLAAQGWTAGSSYVSPESMNTRAIFSRACSTIVYSSNRGGFIRPFMVDMKNPLRPRVSAIEIEQPRNFIAQSLAPDCRTLAMVSDRGGDGLFEIFLYDLEHSSLRKVTDPPGRDEGKPLFAPRGALLGYLADGRLTLYDYVQARRLTVPAMPQHFQTITWSDDGAGLFLEDERFDIWQYDIRTSLFRRVWAASQPGYVSRMISEHHGHLFFTSDHESAFRQIYDLDLHSGSLRRLYPTQHDQFSPVEVDDGHYALRTNVNGNFSALELLNGAPQPESPEAGVVYDFSLEFGPPLLLYSNDHLPPGFYWFQGGGLKPLLSGGFDARQPTAITIKNSAGMTNFLYLPPGAPRAWVVWLHGGPHEQVSPRFNPYFDFLTRENIAVYAINYPGSTGLGKKYALYGRSEEEAIPIQLRAIDQDIRQLLHLEPNISALTVIGVSYGAVLAHRIIATHAEFNRLVDFSGIANVQTVPDRGPKARAYRSALFIYGENDEVCQNPDRKALLARYESRTQVSRLVLRQEGHYIGRRDSVDLILRRLKTFLETPAP